MLAIRISLYLLAFTASNLLVAYYGAKALLITAAFLIPFEFVMRCVFHETWSGWKLVRNLTAISIGAALITIVINHNAERIALASVLAYLSAQVIAGVLYQYLIGKSYLIKVNGSDLAGIIADSVVFQLIAFSAINQVITYQQVLIKFIGGLFWYFIIFKLFKFNVSKH